MDNWDKRVQASAFIWIAFAVAAGLSGLSGTSSGVWITAIAALAAFLSTAVVWAVAAEWMNELPDEKAKRGTAENDARLALLVQLLDEDERRSLKQQLAHDLEADGEALSLAALLKAQDSAKKHGT